MPVIEKIAGGFEVTASSAPRSMEEKRYIEWMELFADGISYRAFPTPGMAPTARFTIAASRVATREHRNLHGLWRAEA